VSLTSYSPRFRTLAASLKGLLGQSVAPDKLILWVPHEDWPKLPRSVRALQDNGLTLCATEDIGPYTKIMPALEMFPGAFIATADDDRYYEASWLEGLASGFSGDLKEIVCRRAHKIVLAENGRPVPYLQWEWDTDCRKRSNLLFPTGVGGVLFPPGCFHEAVTRRDIFTRLAPDADDLWLYWMARLAGSSFRRIGARTPLVFWPKSQRHALWKKNELTDGGNDDKIGQIGAEYGFPFD
jgi:hypothetical protein